MARVSKYSVHDVDGEVLAAGQGLLWLQGLMVGMHADGAKVADYRASQGPVVAQGVALENAQRVAGHLNTVLETIVDVTWARQAKVADVVQTSGAALVKGTKYYLHTGGKITPTAPATVTGDIDQVVGIASSTTELMLLIGTPIVHA